MKGLSKWLTTAGGVARVVQLIAAAIAGALATVAVPTDVPPPAAEPPAVVLPSVS